VIAASQASPAFKDGAERLLFAFEMAEKGDFVDPAHFSANPYKSSLSSPITLWSQQKASFLTIELPGQVCDLIDGFSRVNKPNFVAS
jgi:hypothetical protein